MNGVLIRDSNTYLVVVIKRFDVGQVIVNRDTCDDVFNILCEERLWHVRR